MLLQDVLSFLLCGAAVGPRESLFVSVGTDGTCLDCECSHINQNMASAGIPCCGQHALSICYQQDSSWACGWWIVHTLVLVGTLWQQLESCFFKHCTLHHNFKHSTQPTAEGWGSRNRACWACGGFNPLHWDARPVGQSYRHRVLLLPWNFSSHRDVQKLWPMSWCLMAFYGQ